MGQKLIIMGSSNETLNRFRYYVIHYINYKTLDFTMRLGSSGYKTELQKY